jgi:glycosyltransferase involved in cell wall biosynthesis
MARRDKGYIQILAAANFEVHKGLVVLLTAWSKIARDFPDVRLVVAGDGREKKFLLDYATKLGISESVYFPGWLSENQLEKEFNRDAIVVVPSLIAEAFGLVAAEAQMAGLPVIASDIGGLNEIVKDGQTGFVIPAGQTSGLSEALTTLLGSSELRRKFGAAGRERAIELFGMQQCTAKYVELYQSLREEEG